MVPKQTTPSETGEDKLESPKISISEVVVIAAKHVMIKLARIYTLTLYHVGLHE